NRLPFNLWIVLIGAILIAWAFSLAGTQNQPGSIGYATFVQEVERNRVQEITIEGTRLTGRLSDGERFTTYATQPPSDATVR
ncbi:ATP-dependent metallopeptidase FtsH/Yme1/Tma family protein, partial [Klebsiella pneumoniae]|nr:ATP-dependent metallopeptidase FtsH/Yme1/Tma family protein [Klebsiella pneumoniae]